MLVLARGRARAAGLVGDILHDLGAIRSWGQIVPDSETNHAQNAGHRCSTDPWSGTPLLSSTMRNLSASWNDGRAR